MNSRAPTFTVGDKPIRQTVLRTLVWPAVALALTTGVACWQRNAGWFTVGGGIVSAIGAYYWAFRLFRLGPNRADDQLPPVVIEELRSPVTGLVPLNSEYFNEAQRRAHDNVRAIVGVILAIAGGIIGSVIPFVASVVRQL